MKFIGGLLKKVGIALVVLFIIGAVFGRGSEDSSSSSSSKEEVEVTQEADDKEEAEAQAEQEPEAEPEPEVEPEPEPEEAPIEYQSVTVDDLITVLKDNPLNAKNTYKDTHVRLTGVLSNIDSSGAYFNVNNGDEWSFDSVQCYIENDETLNRIASASMGDTLVVCGTITDVGEILGYSMDVDYIE